ncbi:type II secretory pathway component GspD/PulD (secretin) [Rhizobium leguminosarum]|uniref:Type II secretory pathway component GspD/PulD (Secretin) n=1 Tax=Rhizobium leguminosarum TaxID=384 RepID=A0AAE2SYK8_RHILE|nr:MULTISPECIES: hypothetical protein [Rhizobium]MBB4293126.1 type II secretory pathway component GspD/PulD (secretin) [Rhizobium leguminosarum]MBB4300051.1 type II secretory pathway component GspD/PulD (secretin) [Rhizobium leguminosarum]MBB4311177.1 type II secretory pathway component GspD/PulD (secretin) [Rhizobium leguminosarum]MBB4435404.1 type II secretory pathway component GspD/PulD (secretin) [Rhizobium esperanzae]MBB4532336.1 type II secretory pathway component GspD/PulD (secretin) [R
MFARFVYTAALGLLAAFPLSAGASEREVRLDVVSLPLGDVVQTLSFMSGIPVTTVGTLSGKVEHWSVQESGAKAFVKLGDASNLFVAYDGSRIIIAPKQEVSTVVLDRGGRSWKTEQNAIRALFPLLPDDALREDVASGLVLVRGPAVFVKAVEDVLSRPQDDSIKVIKGGQLEILSTSNGA